MFLQASVLGLCLVARVTTSSVETTDMYASGFPQVLAVTRAAQAATLATSFDMLPPRDPVFTRYQNFPLSHSTDVGR